jgi:hypothetical protein
VRDYHVIYHLYLSSHRLGEVGAYTLTLDVTSPSPNTAGASASWIRPLAIHRRSRGDLAAGDALTRTRNRRVP